MIALYGGLFDYYGIKYQIGFSIDKNLRFIDDDFETWANVDHWIFHFPESGIYIQPLDPSSPPGYLKHDFRGNKLIVMKSLQVGEIESAIAELQDIKPAVPAFMKETIKISFNDNLEPNAKFEYYFKGFGAALFKWLRDATIEDPGFFQSLIRSVAEGRHPDLKFKNFSFKFDDNYGDDYFGTTIFYSAIPDELTEIAGDNIIINAGKYFRHYYSQTYFPDNYPYQTIAKLDEDKIAEFEIKIPEGYTAEIPESAKMDVKIDLGKNRYISLKTGFKTEDKVLIFTIEESQHIGTLEPQEAKLLNPFWTELEKVSQITVLLTKTK